MFLKLNSKNINLIYDKYVEQIISKLKEIKPIDKVVIGISGGIDSTLTLLGTYLAFKKIKYNLNNIIPVMLPTRYNNLEIKDNIKKILSFLSLNYLEYDIDNLFVDANKLIRNNDNENIISQNMQARIRTMILLAIANNKNAIMFGTSDLSEITLGYYTFGGDQISHFNPNYSILKSDCKLLLEYISINELDEIKDNIDIILKNKISAELKFVQDTEAEIGKYELIDLVLYYFYKYNYKREKILNILVKKHKIDNLTAKKYLDNIFSKYEKNKFKNVILVKGKNIFNYKYLTRLLG